MGPVLPCCTGRVRVRCCTAMARLISVIVAFDGVYAACFFRGSGGCPRPTTGSRGASPRRELIRSTVAAEEGSFQTEFDSVGPFPPRTLSRKPPGADPPTLLTRMSSRPSGRGNLRSPADIADTDASARATANRPPSDSMPMRSRQRPVRLCRCRRSMRPEGEDSGGRLAVAPTGPARNHPCYESDLPVESMAPACHLRRGGRPNPRGPGSGTTPEATEFGGSRSPRREPLEEKSSHRRRACSSRVWGARTRSVSPAPSTRLPSFARRPCPDPRRRCVGEPGEGNPRSGGPAAKSLGEVSPARPQAPVPGPGRASLPEAQKSPGPAPVAPMRTGAPRTRRVRVGLDLFEGKELPVGVCGDRPEELHDLDELVGVVASTVLVHDVGRRELGMKCPTPTPTSTGPGSASRWSPAAWR